jgi:hypothetical protein
MEQRLDIYKAKVEVEIDAQQRLLKQFGEGDPQYVRSVQQNLKNLQARMAEVDLGVKNPKSVEDADWLKEAQKPRLFSKPGRSGKVFEEFEEVDKFAPPPAPGAIPVRRFVRLNAKGDETFSVRIEAGNEAQIAWIERGSAHQVAPNLAEVQDKVGRIPRIYGRASDELEGSIRAGTFKPDKAAKILERQLGGEWEIRLTKLPGTGGPGQPKASYNIEAIRTGD